MTTQARMSLPPRNAASNGKPTPKKAPAPVASANDPIARLKLACEWTARSVVGRGDVIRAIALAVVAGQNALLIGVPGTAKTMAVRKVCQCFADKPGDVFDMLFTKFTKPFEVNGPVNLQALEAGKVEVNTAGFLPAARVGILDEVFKGSSAILNSLLTLANERLFKNGAAFQPTPIRMLVGMSNEFPEDPAILAAFFDRFPVKVMVKSLDGDEFAEMLAAVRNPDTSACPVKLTEADFADIDRRVAAVNFPDAMIECLGSIRAQLAAKGVVISDRRFVQAVKLLRAAAVIAGRNVVTRADLPVLETVCWNAEPEIAIIRTILPDFANPFERELKSILDDAYAARQEVLTAANYAGDGAMPPDANRQSPDMVKAAEVAARTYNQIKSIHGRLDMIETEAETDRDRELFDAANASIIAVMDAVKAVVKGKAGVEALFRTSDEDVAVV